MERSCLLWDLYTQNFYLEGGYVPEEKNNKIFFLYIARNKLNTLFQNYLMHRFNPFDRNLFYRAVYEITI